METVEADSIEQAIELTYELGWTDGLPVVPPTTVLIQKALDYFKRDPEEVLGVVPPANRIATVENVVMNCIMAGCLPEHIPVVFAALEAVLTPKFNLNGVQATTNCVAPLIIVSGPVVEQLNFNYGDNVFGGGARANAVVGRALRLILWNLGGAYPGDIDRATLGHPGKYAYCIAERPDLPWEPIHVERGFNVDESCVTVFACESPHHIGTGSGYDYPVEDVFYTLADSMATSGNNNMCGGGQMLLILGPMTAHRLREEGYDKNSVRRKLQELATRPVGLMKRSHFLTSDHPYHWSHNVDASNDEARVPLIRNIDDLLVTVAGGWGSGSGFCAFCPGWMQAGGFAETRSIKFPRS